MGIDINSLTLAEIEALAERLGAAARTIRDAQALLGGGVGGRNPEAAMATAVAVAIGPPVARQSLLTAAEQAEKRRLMKQNFGPDDIEAMERA